MTGDTKAVIILFVAVILFLLVYGALSAIIDESLTSHHSLRRYKMICDPCRTAADKKKTVPAKERWHAKCIGSNQCACQHKVRGKFINENR